ncbi:hypothetical protein H4Q32_003292 [Labeo rohita]|uniref:Uncharacterized protein n=1 Tax=Labeo rohita TaxID=84645 RepID=A0ABQ8MQI3_LABRO|nr:hypothetical protein H4Q32_003292 [Labeo rohita]
MTVFACKLCLICAYFSPDSDKITFSLENVILWIEDSYFSQYFYIKNALMMDFYFLDVN